MKTISAKLAEAKKANPNLNVKEFLEQLQKEDHSLSEGAFAAVAASVAASTFEKWRKKQLTAVLTAAKQASKRFSKDVNEVECYVYECNWCAKNNATEYKEDDYNVFAFAVKAW